MAVIAREGRNTNTQQGAAMTNMSDLDVSLKETKLYVLDEAGNRVWRGRCATEATEIAAAVICLRSRHEAAA